MELETLLLISTIAVCAITVLRKTAKDEVVDLIGALACIFLFILILIISFLFEDSDIPWGLMFGYWAGKAIYMNGDDY